MKQCPVCKTTYTDESQTFCLNDGTRLTDFYDPQKTQALPAGVNATEGYPMRVNIPIDSPSVATQIAPPIVVTTPAPVVERKGCSPLLVAVLFAVLGIFAIGGIVIAYFASKQDLLGLNKTPTLTPTPISSPAVNSNSLDDQKKSPPKTPVSTPSVFSTPIAAPTSPIAAPTSTPQTTPPPGTGNTARVNSPGDGFLAMRSGPSHTTGYQVMKIPHGATVTVYGCQGTTVIAGKSGRWCQVNYDGRNGWAFDAWLIY